MLSSFKTKAFKMGHFAFHAKPLILKYRTTSENTLYSLRTRETRNNSCLLFDLVFECFYLCRLDYVGLCVTLLQVAQMPLVLCILSSVAYQQSAKADASERAAALTLEESGKSTV